MSKVIYVKIAPVSQYIENRPSDFGSLLKYANLYPLHHVFSTTSGYMQKYFEVADQVVGGVLDYDYVTYSIVAVQATKPSNYDTLYSADGRTAAWWSVTVPDNFVIGGGGGVGGTGGTGQIDGPDFNSGTNYFPPTPSRTINGTDASQTINGTTSAELVYGKGGNDTIYLKAGNDLADGGTGDDTVKCGDGHDRAVGGFGNDWLYGEVGNDLLYGSDGNDRLFGGDGFDSLSGFNGNDVLVGDAGNDYLRGGTGRDTLKGGAGRDAFVLDEAPGAANADRILDFRQREDQIVLSDAWYVSDVSRIKFIMSTGEIFYDKHGFDRQVDYVLIASVSPGIALLDSDFAII